MSTQMIDKAKQYAESRRGSWRSLAKEASVSYDWLTKFMQGQIPDPGYYRIERLYKLAVSASKRRKRQE